MSTSKFAPLFLLLAVAGGCTALNPSYQGKGQGGNDLGAIGSEPDSDLAVATGGDLSSPPVVSASDLSVVAPPPDLASPPVKADLSTAPDLLWSWPWPSPDFGSQSLDLGGAACVLGTPNECKGPNEQWVPQDQRCCIFGVAFCIDGWEWDCEGAGGAWSGSTCCLPAPEATCVIGYKSECDDEGERWTGSKCCVDGKLDCQPAAKKDCDGDDEHYTGILCCKK